ncbi:MAG: hypothetical protein OEZ39_01870 [Gammaproteobacteria bacterium]|nr:hypothetical protein [Gammaproteobacteria bacterium]MDH5650601.1 hypothetical protein [Gammaproteobacteria bacterium]
MFNATQWLKRVSLFHSKLLCFARHCVAEASDFSLPCPKKSHQKKGHPIGENVFAMDFILSLADGPSMDHCQCAASLPRLFDDEMHLNHSPIMGPDPCDKVLVYHNTCFKHDIRGWDHSPYRHVVNIGFEIDQCATGSGAARQRYREVPLPGNKLKPMFTTVLPVGETFLVTFDVLYRP